MRAGVTVVDPQTTWLDAGVELAADVTLLPGTQLLGRDHGSPQGPTVGPDTTLRDCVVGAQAQRRAQRTRPAPRSGPARRSGRTPSCGPGTVLGDGAKIGAYVETKSAAIGAGSKVPHLSYVGDAEIGAGSNIGAATVFVNYDGVAKHRTKVGDHVRIGSDTMLVAPVEIGDGAYTAAGSVITEDVPAGRHGGRPGPPADHRGLGRSASGPALPQPAAAAAAGAAAREDWRYRQDRTSDPSEEQAP